MLGLFACITPCVAWSAARPTKHLKEQTHPTSAQGLRANLLRMYNTLTDEGVAQCRNQAKYQKLVFALTYFHRCGLVAGKRPWHALTSMA